MAQSHSRSLSESELIALHQSLAGLHFSTLGRSVMEEQDDEDQEANAVEVEEARRGAITQDYFSESIPLEPSSFQSRPLSDRIETPTHAGRSLSPGSSTNGHTPAFSDSASLPGSPESELYGPFTPPSEEEIANLRRRRSNSPIVEGGGRSTSLQHDLIYLGGVGNDLIDGKMILSRSKERQRAREWETFSTRPSAGSRRTSWNNSQMSAESDGVAEEDQNEASRDTMECPLTPGLDKVMFKESGDRNGFSF